MIAQSPSGEPSLIDTPFLKDREDVVNKIVEAFGNDWETEYETISSPLFHPADDLVGDPAGRADEVRPRRRGVQSDLS